MNNFVLDVLQALDYIFLVSKLLLGGNRLKSCLAIELNLVSTYC